MPLILPPTPPGDTLEEVAAWTGDLVEAFGAAASPFVDALESATEVDFSTIGDSGTLGHLQWDYEAELQQLQTVRPGYLSFSAAEAGADIDAIKAVAPPTAPALDLPTAYIPTLDAERPIISMPALPGTALPAAPSDAPSVTEYALPDAPTVTVPALPTFEELQIPAAPGISMPSFSAVAPTFNLAPPTEQFGYVDAGYTSQLRDPLVAKLLADLENGGYGIEPDDEAALWFRARDRAESAARLAVESVLKAAASTSFPMPQGALFAQLERARRDVQDKMQEANREIALKRADMYVENRKFTIQEVREVEKLAIELYNAIQERAFNAAKAMVELGIAVYDASVRNFMARLESYKTAANVFETLIKAELGKAEVFKAQIEAEKLRGEFNQQRVNLYNAQLNGIKSVVDLYRARAEAVQTLMQVQAQKVEIFRTRVQAYAMTVQAKSAEYDMYKAAVGGEVAKLDVYKTDISAFEARIRAEESRVKVILQANEALLQQYKGQIAQYSAQLESKVKAADARVERDRTYVQGQAVNVSVYKALTDAVLAGIAARKDAQRMNNEWAIAALNSRVEVVRQRMEQMKTTMSNRIDIDKAGANMFTTAMSAAVTSVSGLSVKTAS